jgi:transposase
MAHHRFLLRLHLQQIDAIDAALDQIDREVEGRIAPFRIAVELLITIPGISELSARIITAEIGTDMSRFPTAAHLISWVGLCPKNDESAGKRLSTRMRKGAPWLKTTLIQCSCAAVRKKASYFQAQFHGMAPLTMTSDQIISTAVPKRRKPSASSPDFRTSAMKFRSRPWPRDPRLV